MTKTKTPTLTPQAVKVINDILERGNSVEVKPRKDDLIVLEIKRQVKISVPTSE